MKGNDECLYLISSNATNEYILDILETLSLPFGSIHHFRYQLKWIKDNALKVKLLKKGESGKNKLRNIKVVVCYLYQEEKEKQKQWNWINIYPLRTGVLMDAYRTGDDDEEIAHFYFKVENYVSYDKQDFTKIFKGIFGGTFGQTYAFEGSILEDKYIAKKENNMSAFHKICNSLNLAHFKSDEGKEYYPLYCYINGVKKSSGKFLEPKYDSKSHKSFYKIKEGSLYTFEFAYYLECSFFEYLPEFPIKLLSDNKIFSTPSEYTTMVNSPYDEESWTIISSLLERDIWTVISFKTELTNDVNSKKPLNIHIDFTIQVKRKILYRIIDILTDICFGVGTGAIALYAALKDSWPSNLPSWYWPVIIGYGGWAIGKIIIKSWRG